MTDTHNDTPATPAGVASPPPDFQKFLVQVNDGVLIDDATRELRRIVSECSHLARNQGGKPKATITVKLDVKLVDGVFEVFGEVTTKLPKPVRARSLFYEHQGGLTANNPKQLSLDIPAKSATPAGDGKPAVSVLR